MRGHRWRKRRLRGSRGIPVESFGCISKRGEAIGVQLAWAFIDHDFDCLFVAVSGSVRSIFSERCVYVGDGENARLEWNFFRMKAIWISRAIELFVMGAGDGCQLAELLHAPKN